MEYEIFEALLGLGFEKAGDLLGTAGGWLIKKIKDSQQLEKLFDDSKEIIAQNKDDSADFLNKLSDALSKNNMKQLTKKAKGTNGYDLKKQLEESLMELMQEYEIPYELAKPSCEQIVYNLLEQLKTIDPEKFDQFFRQDWRNEEQESLHALDAKADKLLAEIQQYHKFNMNICPDGEMDAELRRNTANPSIGVDFFEIDDEDFQEEFNKQKGNETVFVRGKCIEETIYCILNELRRSNDNRVVYVVRDKNSWDWLANGNADEGNIYIPWFYADETGIIPNNTCIFVLNENNPAYANSKDVIILRPRTIDTLSRCLREAGMDSEKAYKLLTDTHGLYIPMKKRLFKGKYQMPDWVDGLSDKVEKVCLLLGKWEDIDGDKLIIEDLYGNSYDSFIREVEPYTKGEDPFLYVYKDGARTQYSLASTENAWECIDVSIEDPLWGEFEVDFVQVLNESEELFTLTGQEKLLAQMKKEKLFWSETIRKGMTRALIMKAFYKNTEDCQLEMDRLVREILGYIQTEKQWIYISRFWTDLCEISPRATLDRLKAETTNSTGLFYLFENQSTDFLFDRNSYIDILWGLEQLLTLTQDEYVKDAFEWLVELDHRNYHYVSNSVKDIFDKVLCPWCNFSAIKTPKNKIRAAEYACKSGDHAWQYICEAISNNNMIGRLSYPKYRDHLVATEVKPGDLQETYVGYFKILLNNMEFSAERWIELLKISDDFSDGLRTEAFEELLNEIVRMHDNDIVDIKNAIRGIIYKHRFYSSSSWTMPEEKLCEYEELINEIHAQQPEYEYKYLFQRTFDFPLLHPVFYDEDDWNTRNQEKVEELIQKGLAEFHDKGYRLDLLVKICANENDNSLGESLAKYWNQGIWDEETFHILLGAPDSGNMAVEYMGNVIRANVELYPDIISKVQKWGYKDDILVKIYRTEAAWTKSTPLIDQESDKMKVLFWEQPLPGQDNTSRWAADESKKYADLSVFVLQLYWLHQKTPLSPMEIYKYFEGIESMKCSQINQMTGWYIEQFLEILQKEYLYDDEKCIRISRLEIHFMNIIENGTMQCFLRTIKTNPLPYAQLIEGIFKSDHKVEEIEKIDDTAVKNMYKLYDNTHFCPAEKDGTVEEEELRQWIEKFHALLQENDHESSFTSILGRLFSFSPEGRDGYKPCEAVRNVIEEYADEKLIDSYESSVINERGIYSPSAGKEEKRMAEEFQEDYEYLKDNYPGTAKIYKKLSSFYMSDSERERLAAENGEE